MRVALFSTCLVDALFPDAGKATVRILERLGQPVEFPLEQTCCGQMHANSGYFEVGLVRRQHPPPARDGRPRGGRPKARRAR